METKVNAAAARRLQVANRRVPCQLTVKVPALVAMPPDVVTLILPVFAPDGDCGRDLGIRVQLKACGLGSSECHTRCSCKL